LTKTTISLGLLLLLNLNAAAQKTYTVQKGDSLAKIAKKHGLTPRQVLNANSLDNPNKLKLGMSLTIPGKVTASKKATPAKTSGGYIVKAGDGEWTIAKKLKTTPKLLRAANPGVNFAKLLPGVQLSVPGSKTKLAAKPKLTVIAEQPKVEPIQVVVHPEPGESVVQPEVAFVPEVVVAKIEKPAEKSVPVVKYVEVARSAATLRAGATTTAKRLAMVKKGVPAKILEKKGSWCHLLFASGTKGWMRSDMLTDSTPAKNALYAKVGAKTFAKKTPVKKPVFAKVSSGLSIDGLLSYARGMVGTRYSYGSMSRSATDCSGFTCQVFRSQGIKLPRTSYQQARIGTAVPKDQLKAGDLVFFHTRGGRRVSHVGIYVGSGKFMHASITGYRVRTDSLGSSYYARTYAGARRVAKFASVQAATVAAAPKLDDPIQDVPEITTEPVATPPVGTDAIIK